MGNLIDMRYLYLDHNSLHGTIASEFWKMDVLGKFIKNLYKNSHLFLVDLTLGDNNLEGSIHESIGQLTSLGT